MANTITKIQVRKGQNIYDIATWMYGSSEGVFTLMADNPDKIPNLNAVLVVGDYLKISPDKVINQNIVNYYSQLGKDVNTGDEVELAPDYNEDYNEDFLI